MTATKTRTAPRTNIVDAGSVVIAAFHGRHGKKVRPTIVIEPNDDGWQALAITTQRFAANGIERPLIVDQRACGLLRPCWLWSPFTWQIIDPDVRNIGKTITPAAARQIADFLADRDQADRFLDRYAYRIAQ